MIEIPTLPAADQYEWASCRFHQFSGHRAEDSPSRPLSLDSQHQQVEIRGLVGENAHHVIALEHLDFGASGDLVAGQ